MRTTRTFARPSESWRTRGPVRQEEKQPDDCEQHQYVPKRDRTKRLDVGCRLAEASCSGTGKGQKERYLQRRHSQCIAAALHRRQDAGCGSDVAVVDTAHHRVQDWRHEEARTDANEQQ